MPRTSWSWQWTSSSLWKKLSSKTLPSKLDLLHWFWSRIKQFILVTKVTQWWELAREFVKPVVNGQGTHQSVNTVQGKIIYPRSIFSLSKEPLILVVHTLHTIVAILPQLRMPAQMDQKNNPSMILIQSCPISVSLVSDLTENKLVF